MISGKIYKSVETKLKVKSAL